MISKHFQKGLKTFQSLPPEGITIFGSQLHTHLTGLRVITRHVRDGRELLELNRDNHYSTHFQEIRLLKRPVRVLPVSRLDITCNNLTFNPYFKFMIDRDKVNMKLNEIINT